jgi:nitrite reductase/ring-hydroxylating ferredoxin subunit
MIDRAGELHACSLSEIQEKGCLVAEGPVPIAIFYDGGKLFAVDNRCPHMGFPLHRGTVDNGVLTCHWHHARFDAQSGCTFDLFADDVTAYPISVRDGEVYINTQGNATDPVAVGKQRLLEGMQQNIRLVIAKAVVKLVNAGVSTGDIARQGGLFGVGHRRTGWGPGLTILTAMANVSDHLADEERIAPLYQGLLQVARDSAGQPPKFTLQPLGSSEVELASLKTWFRDLVEVRSVDGAERCLLTAIHNGASPGELADLMLSAATDHYYLDGGHVVDFINKAFELLDRIGWQNAAEVLPSLVRLICQAQRSEEQNAWRNPLDLVQLLDDIFSDIPALLEAGEAKSWQAPEDLADLLLGDDPRASVEALKQALVNGAQPVQLAKVVASAASLRVARFHVQNEFADWIAVLHTFTYSNALHQLLKRAQSGELLRGVFHGAVRIYLDRFLNIPPARLPKGGGDIEQGAFQKEFLALLDNQQQADEAGRRVYAFLASGGDPGVLFATLAESLLREDGEFHSFQMLEAAIRQFGEQDDQEQKWLMMVAAARYLAAHAPTQRELQQTLRIALRLHRGDPVYEAE